ncbi:caspase activity and apoptosis inhibitor 1 isoform X2 [Osmerus mordax]|uniref:caspase activity and apoptosis inhibitor 1 isoform X2 n=1 Tax=Osmerus mordax TaxID=8014 RepID=UPI0035106C63
MLKKKSTSRVRDNKRKHSQTEEQHVDRRPRGTESNVEDVKDELADPELDKVGSDIEEGGLDLSVPFKPISAYITDRQEMLDQCFHVLGDKKLQKMLPDELKVILTSCCVEEIKKLCLEQLEQLSQTNLLQILAGEELSSGGEEECKLGVSESQQDNIVDSTSSLKETCETEDKQEDAGSGEESDVLSINADTYDSDIEGHKDKDKQAIKPEETTEASKEVATATPDPANPEPVEDKPIETKIELEKDINKSVNEILALAPTPSHEDDKELVGAPPVEAPVLVASQPVQSAPLPGPAPAACQPSVQQLELLELEMRARAIKALMKANNVNKTS